MLYHYSVRSLRSLDLICKKESIAVLDVVISYPLSKEIYINFICRGSRSCDICVISNTYYYSLNLYNALIQHVPLTKH